MDVFTSLSRLFACFTVRERRCRHGGRLATARHGEKVASKSLREGRAESDGRNREGPHRFVG
jgi:hypothetical protein